MPTCKSCGAVFGWYRTKSGKAMPVDPDAVADGNVRLLADGTAEVMSDTERMIWDGPKYKSHFATCPGAASHRKPK